MGDGESERRSFAAVVKRRNKWLLGLAALPFALIPVLVTLAVLRQPFFAAFSIHLAMIGALTFSYVLARNPKPRLEPVRVAVTERDVTVGDERIARSEITRGDLVDGSGGLRLEREGRRRTELQMRSSADAEALMRALDLDVSQTTASFRTMSMMQATKWRSFFIALGTVIPGAILSGIAANAHPLLGSALFGLTMIAFFTLMFAPTRVEVGGDGVLWRWLGRERFIPHDQIELAYSTIDGTGRNKRAMVMLQLVGGEVARIPVGAPFWGGEAKADALAIRIDAARRAHERGVVAPEVLRRPEGAPVLTWIRKLRARDVVGHREAVIPRDRLWGVVEDAAADPIERAAATVALGALPDPERARLARVAKRTAAPKLRVLLESAPEAEEAELAELLEEVEASAPRTAKAQ